MDLFTWQKIIFQSFLVLDDGTKVPAHRMVSLSLSTKLVGWCVLIALPLRLKELRQREKGRLGLRLCNCRFLVAASYIGVVILHAADLLLVSFRR